MLSAFIRQSLGRQLLFAPTSVLKSNLASFTTYYIPNYLGKKLSDDISSLKKVGQKECSSYTMCKESGQGNLQDTPGEQPQGISPAQAQSSKKRKSIHISESTAVPYVDVEHPSDQLVSREKSGGAPNIQQVPKYHTFRLSCIFILSPNI